MSFLQEYKLILFFRNLPDPAKEVIDANIKEFNEQRAEMDREVSSFIMQIVP